MVTSKCCSIRTVPAKVFDASCGSQLSAVEESRVWKLLEMQRSALLMFASCGWFFSDLAGIETIQVMRYAARVIDLQDELGLDPPEKKFLEMMSEAKSNRPEKGTGADYFCAFESFVGAALRGRPVRRTPRGGHGGPPLQK